MRVLLPGVLAVFLTACGGTEVGPTTPLDIRITVGLGQTAVVKGAGIGLRFDAVPEDSRCPADAMCIWQGVAAVNLTVLGARSAHAVQLRTDPPPARVATAAGLRLELVQLDPYPFLGRPAPPGDYRVTIRVIR